MALVLLWPGESVLRTPDPAGPAVLLDEDDLRLARLAARGASRVEMATRLGLSRRTVDRRLAVLRDRFGVRSAAELAAALTQRGIS